VNWHVCESLFHYDADTGLRLVGKTVDMMVKDGRATCWEFHNPLTGEGRRAVDNGFSAMPIQAILQRVFGVNPHPTSLELKPYFPRDWPEASVKNVFAGGTSLDVTYARSGSKISAKVKNTGAKATTVISGSNELRLKPGQEGNLQIP
jgi:cellobiose phosphorylase